MKFYKERNIRNIIVVLCFCLCHVAAQAVDLKRSCIAVGENEPALVQRMARVMSEDVERVCGVKPMVTVGRTAEEVTKGDVVLTTAEQTEVLRLLGVDAEDIHGDWERYKIVTLGKRLVIVGSDARGLAYGVLHISERIGVSPWYWWADVPVAHRQEIDYKENITSRSPSVKYRGIFINDEDWGLKTWASQNFEKELNDIGPKTYDKVCELLLRLKGNMLAPAMHTCTGAFYSHPESQVKAAEWGIMITTSHCEPLLLNNAAPSEWEKTRDGEWNYLTNKATIKKKWDDRLRETASYDNIYTMGMRGLHDEAMKGSTDPKVRALTLEQVFDDQREILSRWKGKAAEEIPQIFVPYKETLDIYDAGLNVPEDITLVWPDDNYGYMKRVSNASERKRRGGAGVYYHLSYLGTPHDYLWICTTPPVLMYEELLKAYKAGADRYWLLNVGDIKPMEMGMQEFMDMAWDMEAFNYERARVYQAQWLASMFGKNRKKDFQQLLDTYYRLAWERKPEYMGYEMEWDSEENNRLHDTDFSTAERKERLKAYEAISDLCDAIEAGLPREQQTAFFEVIGFAVKSACQMNRKFLLAHDNHETGSRNAAEGAKAAQDSIGRLMHRYNTMLDGKWNQMMSEVPPGICAKYQLMPELTSKPTNHYALPENQRRVVLKERIDMGRVKPKGRFRMIEGLGMDGKVLQLGEPLDKTQDPKSLTSDRIDLTFTTDGKEDSVQVCVSVVPMWPVSLDKSNRFGVSVDGAKAVVCENRFEEWSYPWKLQVLANRKDFLLTFPLQKGRKRHTLSLIIGDPGQMVQRVSYTTK